MSQRFVITICLTKNMGVIIFPSYLKPVFWIVYLVSFNISYHQLKVIALFINLKTTLSRNE